MNYQEFLAKKAIVDKPAGLDGVIDLHPKLFGFQRALVDWALKRGRAALFCDAGLGKTFMQLEWAYHVLRNTQKRVLIVAPLAVAHQTVKEAEKFGYKYGIVRYAEHDDRESHILVTNYEKLHHFDCGKFGGVVLDESSILKSHDGKFRSMLIEEFAPVPYRLACTATPAPNDFMELGNHAEFLGVMSRVEMLSMFFVHDGGETSKWRLKGHAESEFWKWMASWSVMIRKPQDLGFNDEGYTLPELRYHQHTVEGKPAPGQLFALEAQTLQERLIARRESVDDRVKACADLVNNDKSYWIVWCNLNSESEALKRAIPDAVEVKGSDSPEQKEKALAAFSDGSVRVLISKPSICGFGMNWQHCHKMAFVGLSDSFEQMYQAVRRCWRFGQDKPVDVHLITATTEGAVVSNIKRKEADAERMAAAMVEHMKDISIEQVTGTRRIKTAYNPSKQIELPSFIVA